MPHHPDADTIYERYAASAHAGSAGPGYSEYSTDENLQNGHMTDHLPFGHNCIKCHTHEGAIKYLEVDDADGIAAIDDGAGNTYTSIQCKTCHDPHEAGKLLEPAVHEEHPIYAEDGVTLIGLENITVSSAQFNTCMNCHDHEGYHLTRNTAWSMLETHGDKTSVLVVSDELEGGEGHFDVTELTNRDGDLDIASSLGISNFTYEYTNDIEGYVIDETSEDSCSACHDIHGPKNEINEQWAKSGHAAEIGLVKEELGPDAVITLHDEDERHSVVAFTEQNWGFGADREECQRCHTTTGASNYLGNEVDYNSASNDFSHLDPVYDDATGEFLSSKVEFLSCEACHTSATTGELRITDTDITLDYTYGGEEIVLAGVNESTTCLTCHGGWGNNDSLRQITDENRDFHGVLHHGPAGAILFAEQTHPAYEFDGQVYSKGNLHATLGTTDASGNEVVAGTGTAGPCVTCHMSSDNNHSNIVAENLDVCNTCHEISEARLTELNEQRVQTQALIRDYINKTVPLNADGVSTGIKGVALPEYPLEYYRAAMNWWVVFDDRGAEAHNPAYVKQVAFDTIDYLDDGVLNGTINIDPATWPLALEWLNGTATGMITRP
ncbi:MAG: hypothetical protein C0624_00705 [Desulfuromonas sp.]|nr:MAG: hypothetical protein C0624_00705 [Desulfuromonas sp.]